MSLVICQKAGAYNIFDNFSKKFIFPAGVTKDQIENYYKTVGKRCAVSGVTIERQIQLSERYGTGVGIPVSALIPGKDINQYFR